MEQTRNNIAWWALFTIMTIGITDSGLWLADRMGIERGSNEMIAVAFIAFTVGIFSSKSLLRMAAKASKGT